MGSKVESLTVASKCLSYSLGKQGALDPLHPPPPPGGHDPQRTPPLCRAALLTAAPPPAVAAMTNCLNTFVGSWKLTPDGYLVMSSLDTSLAPVCLSVDSSNNVYETVCQVRGSCSCATFSMVSHAPAKAMAVPEQDRGAVPPAGGSRPAGSIAVVPAAGGVGGGGGGAQRLLVPLLTTLLGTLLVLLLVAVYAVWRPHHLPWLHSKLQALRSPRSSELGSQPDSPGSRGSAGAAGAAVQLRGSPAASLALALPLRKASAEAEAGHVVLEEAQLQALASIDPLLWEQYSLSQLPAVDWLQLLQQHRLLHQNSGRSGGSTGSSARGAQGRERLQDGAIAQREGSSSSSASGSSGMGMQGSLPFRIDHPMQSIILGAPQNPRPSSGARRLSVSLNSNLVQEPDELNLAAAEQRQKQLRQPGEGDVASRQHSFAGLPMNAATRQAPTDEPSPFLLARDLALAALAGSTAAGTMDSLYSSVGLGLGGTDSSGDGHRRRSSQQGGGEPERAQGGQAGVTVEDLQQELPDLDLNIDVPNEIKLHQDGFLGAGSFGWAAPRGGCPASCCCRWRPGVWLAGCLLAAGAGAARCRVACAAELVAPRLPSPLPHPPAPRLHLHRCVYKGTYKGREVAVKLLSKMFDGDKGSSRMLLRCAAWLGCLGRCGCRCAARRLPLPARPLGAGPTRRAAAAPAFPQLPARDAHPGAAAPPQRGGAAGRLPHAAQHLHRRGAHEHEPGGVHLHQVRGACVASCSCLCAALQAAARRACTPEQQQLLPPSNAHRRAPLHLPPTCPPSNPPQPPPAPQGAAAGVPRDPARHALGGLGPVPAAPGHHPPRPQAAQHPAGRRRPGGRPGPG
jgi:hypothetical protein